MKRLLAMLTAVCFTAISCTNTPNTASEKDTTKTAGGAMTAAGDMLEKNRAAALASVQGFINHDASQVVKDCAPDFVDYGDGSTPPVKGIDSCKATIQSFLTAFPDTKGENLMAIAEGNHVAVFGDWSGTFKAKMMDMEPTGKSFKMHDVDLFTFNTNGQITDHRSIQSMETMMMQVGAKKK